MKRSGLVLCAVLAALPFACAHAGQPMSGGSILLPAPSSSVQREARQTAVPNGTFGFVVGLSGSIDNKTYTLTLTHGATGLENLEVLFYRSLDGNGDPCALPTDRHESGAVETGTACPSSAGAPQARYAIVFMPTGASAAFTLTIA